MSLKIRLRFFRVISILFVGLLFQASATSQENLKQGRQDQGSLKIVVPNKELSQKETVSLSGTFNQKKYISVLPNPLLSRGSFSFSKGTAAPNLIWTTIEPIESVLYLDAQGIRQDVEGKTAWNIAADQPAVATLTEVITAVLSSDWTALKNYFDISIVDLSKEEISKEHSTASVDNTIVQLTSRDAALKSVVTSMKIVLGVPPTKELVAADLSSIGGDVKQLIMYEANSDRTEIAFSFSDDNE